MRQIRVSKRPRPSTWRFDPREPLPLDPRDPDIVRAKELDRRGARGQSAQSGSRRLGRA